MRPGPLSKSSLAAVLLFTCMFTSCKDSTSDTSTGGMLSSELIIADHSSAQITSIPESYIRKAKRELRIAYGHTSHGSQLVDGMTGLVQFRGTLYAFNPTGADSALTLRDMPFSGAADLGNPDRAAWATATRTYLNAHPEINVVIWSWCGQVSSATSGDIALYLSLMDSLERSYPAVRFVYMTGHLDGSGVQGNLHQRNEQIRSFCKDRKRILFDFADIESYNPDGSCFVDKLADDNCDYDSDGNGSRDRNWAQEWQNTHPGQWYSCGAAHSQPLNANRKAYAAWWLWARLAGWGG